VSGSSAGSIPSGASASAIALAIAAGAPIVPDSPTPRKAAERDLRFGFQMMRLDVGQLGGRRHKVVHQRAGQ
jgi:hypothetical protein